MKIAYITAGAAGMYCGSCMHDNTLVSALIARGHDALLIPTYTPIRTDEENVSQNRVFFGGINVYLQQKYWLFRRTPWLLDRLLDFPPLLRWVSKFAVQIEAENLGDLTISMLQGEDGHQAKEVEKLAAWLADELKPDVINLTNVLLSGVVHEIKRRRKVPILGMLQGDDIYLESLPERYRTEAKRLITDHCREMDGFIATSTYYADFMADYLSIPRERIDVVLPGLNLTGHGGPRPDRNGQVPTIGYFARICPEKGLHNLVEAYRLVRQSSSVPYRLRIGGWLGDSNKAYFEDLKRKLDAWGLGKEVEHLDAPSHADKVRFLHGIDVLSVPTTYREPKGLYVMEALANGIPVVQPRHGSFPELIEATGGGLLVNPEDPQELARGLLSLLENESLRIELGRKGQEAVLRRFHAAQMADDTLAVYEKFVTAPVNYSGANVDH